MNLIEQYRKAHPERTVWSPEKGWHDSDDGEFVSDWNDEESELIYNNCMYGDEDV